MLSDRVIFAKGCLLYFAGKEIKTLSPKLPEGVR